MEWMTTLNNIGCNPTSEESNINKGDILINGASYYRSHKKEPSVSFHGVGGWKTHQSMWGF